MQIFKNRCLFSSFKYSLQTRQIGVCLEQCNAVIYTCTNLYYIKNIIRLHRTSYTHEQRVVNIQNRQTQFFLLLLFWPTDLGFDKLSARQFQAFRSPHFFKATGSKCAEILLLAFFYPCQQYTQQVFQFDIRPSGNFFMFRIQSTTNLIQYLEIVTRVTSDDFIKSYLL